MPGRGIGDFARALWRSWNNGDAQAEGRPDAEADAVSIITMHSAKGLEWPIVIPINSTSTPWSDTNFLYRRQDDSVHFKIFGFPSPGHRKQSSRKKMLSYGASAFVSGTSALTRARDLLLLPRQSERIEGDWFSLINIDVETLPLFDGARIEGAPAAEVGTSPQCTGCRNMGAGGDSHRRQPTADNVAPAKPS